MLYSSFCKIRAERWGVGGLPGSLLTRKQAADTMVHKTKPEVWEGRGVSVPVLVLSNSGKFEMQLLERQLSLALSSPTDPIQLY